MYLIRLLKKFYLAVILKSVPTLIQGFHRVLRGLQGWLDVVIALAISSIITLDGLYWIRHWCDCILLEIWDCITTRRRITRRVRLWYIMEWRIIEII